MNALIDFKERGRIRRRPRKGLQMIHNGTPVAARLLIEFKLGRGAQVLARVDVLESHGSVSRPVLGTTTAFHNPIVASVPVGVARAVARHFLLSTERTLRQVRVQILHGVLVREANGGSAFDGLGQLASGVGAEFGLVLGVVRRAKPPQRIVGGGVFDKRDNLLARSAAQLLFFRREVIVCVPVPDFDKTAARYKMLVVGCVCVCVCVCENRRMNDGGKCAGESLE